MKRPHHLLIGTVILVAAATTVFAQRRAAEAHRPADDRTTLLAHIARLEERITKLEADVRKLRSQRTIITTPTIPAPAEPLPPGWKEGEFNGLKVYIVPCTEPATVKPAPAAPAPTIEPKRK